MTDELVRRWDDSMESAWRTFRQGLGDQIAALGDRDSMCVELPDETVDGAMPYCQVLRVDDRLCVEASSNHYLSAEARLEPAQEEALVELGFAAPTHRPEQRSDGGSANFWTEVTLDRADLAAVLVVRSLREVFGVLHPVYLEGNHPGRAEERADDREPESWAVTGGAAHGSAGESPGGDPEAQVTCPSSAEELRALVADALTVLLGEEPEVDEDDDFVVPTARGAAWVTVAERLPRLLIHATVATGIVDEERALVEVNLLNRNEIGLGFVLVGNDVMVRRELGVRAFSMDDVALEIERVRDNLDRWGLDLIARVGGRLWADQAPARQPVGRRPTTQRSDDREVADPRFTDALAVLQELENDQRGSVDPDTMLRVFHHDRVLLTLAIRETDGRLRTVRKKEREALQAGNSPRVVRVCRSAKKYLRDLRSRQRAALRLAVQAGNRPPKSEQQSLFDSDEVEQDVQDVGLPEA